MDVRDNFKEWCNKVIGGETLVDSRPKNENVLIIYLINITEPTRQQ